MSQNTLKPSVIPSLYQTINKFLLTGLDIEDLITLIQRDTKLSRTNIKMTIDSLRRIERKITK